MFQSKLVAGVAALAILLSGCASATLRETKREDAPTFHRLAVVVEAPTWQFKRTAEAALASRLQVSGVYVLDADHLERLGRYHKITDRRTVLERAGVDGVLVLTPIAYNAGSPWAETRVVLYDARTNRPVWSGLTSTTRWVEGSSNNTYRTTTRAEAEAIVRQLHADGAVGFSLDALRN